MERPMANYIIKHKKITLILTFMAIWIIASTVFYLRFPNNYIFPNFFAEDGQHFTQNIIDKGFIGGLLTPFNGYFIFGIYILTGIGFIVNDIFFSGAFTNIPGSLAIVSYSFLGLCAALPILLLKDYLALPYRISIALLIAVLPFPSFDYGIIGTIGNLKFAFNYIAFLLILYRINMPAKSHKIIAIDIILFICAFTTAGVYLILPFILLSKNLNIWQLIKDKKIKTIFIDYRISFFSAIALAGLCISQIVFIVLNGIPKLPGYLDQPYDFSKTIEVFIARSYLYPFVSALYNHLSDILVVLMFTFVIALTVIYSTKNNWKLYVIGFISILTTSMVFVVNRTGTAFYYNNYSTSGFDNFFYAQNFIAIVLAIMLLSDLSTRFNRISKLYISFLVVLALTACSIRTNTTYAPNDFMQYQIRTIQEQAISQCNNSSEKVLKFSVYPFSFLTMSEPRSELCTESLNTRTPLIQYISSDTFNNYKTLDINKRNNIFTQTFVANQDNLSALGVYLSTYYSSTLNSYSFKLMDSSCKNTLQTLPMPRYVRDNSFRTIDFETIVNSKNKTYCFSIYPETDNAQQLALQLTSIDNYKDGELLINNKTSDNDIVFNPVYKQQ
jgi:hypothetical protein